MKRILKTDVFLWNSTLQVAKLVKYSLRKNSSLIIFSIFLAQKQPLRSNLENK